MIYRPFQATVLDKVIHIVYYFFLDENNYWLVTLQSPCGIPNGKSRDECCGYIYAKLSDRYSTDYMMHITTANFLLFFAVLANLK